MASLAINYTTTDPWTEALADVRTFAKSTVDAVGHGRQTLRAYFMLTR